MTAESRKTRDEAALNVERLTTILQSTLASTPDVRFLHSIWAARAIQSDRVASGLSLLRDVPEEARSSDITCRLALRPWELELLANERLALPAGALFQTVDPMRWNQIAHVTNLVRALEGDEYILHNDEEAIVDYLFKIGARQFEWQQGFLTKQELFRSVFVYGQGKCADYFEHTYGVTINDFTATCFAYLSLFFEKPQAVRDIDLDLVNVSPIARESALKLISRHLREVKGIAQRERSNFGEIAFKPSVLRRFPLIGVTSRSYHLCCPIPDLLMNRMTFGLFYDVIHGGGPIREEIGRNFESYAKMVIGEFLPSLNCEREFPYVSKAGQRRSPDLLIRNDRGELELLMECKASRLPLSTRYANFDRHERGYREMIKGVIQIWRFMADVRLGMAPCRVGSAVVGAILTLDCWFVAAPKRQEQIIDEALSECRLKHHEVEDVDQIPVGFVYMPEFERALAHGTIDSIMSAFRHLATSAGRGYSFDYVEREQPNEEREMREFPFEGELCSLLPWWSMLMSGRAEGQPDSA